jgi:hypothetical protein
VEGFGVFIGPCDKGFDGGAELIFAGKACAVKSLARQQAEPDLNLIEPTSRSCREVKVDPTFVLGEPIIISFVSAVVIQDHMDLFSERQFGNHTVREKYAFVDRDVISYLPIWQAKACDRSESLLTR